MDKPELFQIGTVAKLFHLSVSSLRHYEDIGLLKPEYVSPESGYRYYSARQLESAQHARLDEITLTRAPACRLCWIQSSLKIRSSLDMEPPIRRLEETQKDAVVFLGKVGLGITPENLYAGAYDQYDGIFLVLDEEDEFTGPVTDLPETDCLCVRFRGSHPEAPAQYRRLMACARQRGLTVTGFSREITLIDYGITDDTEKFVTEISLPVAPQA